MIFRIYHLNTKIQLTIRILFQNNRKNSNCVCCSRNPHKKERTIWRIRKMTIRIVKRIIDNELIGHYEPHGHYSIQHKMTNQLPILYSLHFISQWNVLVFIVIYHNFISNHLKKEFEFTYQIFASIGIRIYF